MGIITLMEFINLTRYVSYCGQLYELLKIALNDLVCKLELSFFLILVLVLFQMRIFQRHGMKNSIRQMFDFIQKENASNEKRESFNICCYFRSSYLLDLPKIFCVFNIVFVSVTFIYSTDVNQKKKGIQKTFFLQKRQTNRLIKESKNFSDSFCSQKKKRKKL